MKNSKLRRILLTLACAVLLVSLSVGATLAYMTSTTDVVTNTFKVGDVDITLDEAKVDEYGVAVEGAARVTENTYKLLPNHLYIKDPIIHVVKGSEQCYLFVQVVNEIAALEADTKIAAQMTANGWVALGDAYPNIYYYNKVVDARDAAVNVPVFDNFKISSDVKNKPKTPVAGELYLEDYAGKTITVQAYAVQKDGFDSASLAYQSAPCTAWGTTTTTPETGA